MGNNPSTRATHFQRPELSEHAVEDEVLEDHHISISNKMVERLVEDAALTDGVDGSSFNPRDEYKENMFIEKLKSIDEKHTERCGLTVRGLNAILKRVELRTADMVSVEPVCADMKYKIIECYNSTSTPAEVVNCWNTVGSFTKCVQEAGVKRIHERSEREALELERRSRHVAHAREHALKDLS